MLNQIRDIIDKKSEFEINVAIDAGDQRIGISKYLDKNIKFRDNVLTIEDIGEFGIDNFEINVTALGLITIKPRNAAINDLITII